MKQPDSVPSAADCSCCEWLATRSPKNLGSVTCCIWRNNVFNFFNCWFLATKFYTIFFLWKCILPQKFVVNQTSTFWVIPFCVYLLGKNNPTIVPHRLNVRGEFTLHRRCFTTYDFQNMSRFSLEPGFLNWRREKFARASEYGSEIHVLLTSSSCIVFIILKFVIFSL